MMILTHYSIKALPSFVWITSVCDPGWVMSPSEPIPTSPPLQRRIKKLKNAPRSIGLENKWVLGNLHHLNSLCGLPIVPGQNLASLYLIGISPSGIFIEFSTLLTHLNSVGTSIWKGALISWRWWNAVILRQSVCHEGLRTNQQRSQCQGGTASLDSPCLSQVFSFSLHAMEWVFIYNIVFEPNFWLITNVLCTQR